MLCYASAVEDVFDLTDGHGLVTRVLYAVQVGLRGRGDAVVVAVLVLPFVGAGLAVEGTGDDPFDHDLTLADKHLVGLFGSLIQFIERDYAGMRGDLENGVGRGVEDPGSRLLLLGAQLLYDLCPRGRSVPKDPAPRLVLEAAQYFVGEAFRICRERVFEHEAHHLPMSCEGGLGRRSLDHQAVGSCWRFGRWEAFDLLDVA